MPNGIGDRSFSIVPRETFRGNAQKCRRKGGIAEMPFRGLLHANRRAHIGGGVIVDHEKPFKGVEVSFDCSPNQVLAVCSLYVFLQRSNVYIMEIL